MLWVRGRVSGGGDGKEIREGGREEQGRGREEEGRGGRDGAHPSKAEVMRRRRDRGVGD